MEKPQTISVYKDSPAFDTVERWWMLPAHVLNPLYVCTYEVHCDDWDIEHAAAKVREMHPDDVLMYVGRP